MKSLSILVGIPASGKSTFAATCEGMLVVSADQIREEVTGDINNQEENAKVFRMLNERIKHGLAEGLDVVVDATNLKKSYREGLLEIAKTAQARSVAVRFADSADYELCQRRNLARERVVPEHVMIRFHTMFLQNCTAEQLWDEGWVVVDIVRP